MNKLYYEKNGTYEITENHKEAVEWYRKGFNVNLRKLNPETGELEIVLTWEW